MKQQITPEEAKPKPFCYVWYVELWLAAWRVVHVLAGIATAPLSAIAVLGAMFKLKMYKIGPEHCPVGVSTMTWLRAKMHEKLLVVTAVTFWSSTCALWLTAVVGFFTQRNDSVETVKLASAAAVAVTGTVWVGTSPRRRKLNDELWEEELQYAGHR